MKTLQLNGWFADFEQQNFFYGRIFIEHGRIREIKETGERRLTWAERHGARPIILPGLVDSHIHIESSMLMPSVFARQAAHFGTVATISDPHEIANVLGLDGIRLMMEDAEKACIRIYFTAPSCVPATLMESSGAVLEADDLTDLFKEDKVVALGEMMNFPGVLTSNAAVMKKLDLAKKFDKPIDGHAPGLSGTALDQYIQAGITTDHECSTESEAEEKIHKGMKVLIREGSSARNFDQLIRLIDRYPDKVMLCSDDLHPDDLLNGHLDRLIRRGVEAGVNFFNLYRAASLNPISHYQLNTGTLKPGDPADFIVAAAVDPFRVVSTIVNGKAVFRDDRDHTELPALTPLNNFHAKPILPKDLGIIGESGLYKIIQAYDGELLTDTKTAHLVANDGIVMNDLKHDILKIVVINRYEPSKPALGWITGFGLSDGALASSIAHDSHNIIAVGTSDTALADAINLIIRHSGGISAVGRDKSACLPLPVAGLMSVENAKTVGTQYAELSAFAKTLGSSMKAPYMALSFMALLVIPHLKISDKGLFDGETFTFTDLKAI